MKRNLLVASLLALFQFLGSGCLVHTGFTPAGAPLPASLKGYELYSWADAGRTWFTLLPGTNRLKAPDEVFSGERNSIDPNGAFAITFSGLDAVGGQLARLPSSASVFMSTVRYPPGAALEQIATPEPVAQALRADATALGLDLQVLP